MTTQNPNPNPTANRSTASLRIELFPATLPRSLDFYTRIMGFRMLRHEQDPQTPELGYAYLARDTIRIGLATKPAAEYPLAARDPADRAQFRVWPTGTELVLEVDDVKGERDQVVDAGWPLDADLTVQEWGLTDFRVRDPDGYYLRVTGRGTRDGRGDLGEIGSGGSGGR